MQNVFENQPLMKCLNNFSRDPITVIDMNDMSYYLSLSTADKLRKDGIPFIVRGAVKGWVRIYL